MTKYKEFLRAKGIKLECDYEFLPCDGVETVRTRVLYNGVVAISYSNITTPEGIMYNRRGECCWFDYIDGIADLFLLPYDNAYVDWIINMGCDEFDVAFDIMKDMYHNDAKVRIAFNHVKAGIMDELVFYRWISDRYQKYTNY